MRKVLLFCSVVVLTALPASAQGGLQLTIANGRVTLIADHVPVRTVLQEWARLGQSTIVNAEKVVGAPLTLRLIDVPEAEALDIVLRSASGYLAAPRAEPVSNASRFDRIVILASSRPTTSAPPPLPMQQQPMRPQPQQPYPSNPPMDMPIVEEDEEPVDDDQPHPEEAAPPQPGVAARPGPVQPANPNDPQAAPGQQPMPGQPPATMTAPRPGLVPSPRPTQPQPQPPSRPIP